MTDQPRSADLDQLLAWQEAGARWHVVSFRDQTLEIALCRRDGVEVNRLVSAEPDLVRYALGLR